MIDDEVRRLVDEARRDGPARARAAGARALDRVAEALIERETLTLDEVEQIVAAAERQVATRGRLRCLPHSTTSASPPRTPAAAGTQRRLRGARGLRGLREPGDRQCEVLLARVDRARARVAPDGEGRASRSRRGPAGCRGPAGRLAAVADAGVERPARRARCARGSSCHGRRRTAARPRSSRPSGPRGGRSRRRRGGRPARRRASADTARCRRFGGVVDARGALPRAAAVGARPDEHVRVAEAPVVEARVDPAAVRSTAIDGNVGMNATKRSVGHEPVVDDRLGPCRARCPASARARAERAGVRRPAAAAVLALVVEPVVSQVQVEHVELTARPDRGRRGEPRRARDELTRTGRPRSAPPSSERRHEDGVSGRRELQQRRRPVPAATSR